MVKSRSLFLANQNNLNESKLNVINFVGSEFDLTSIMELRNTNAQYKMVPGPRLNSEMLFATEEKQLYKKNKKNAAGHMGYTCRGSDCGARVYKRPNGEVYYPENYEGHRHASVEESQQEMQLKNDIKVKWARKLYTGKGTYVGTVSEIFSK